MVRNMESRRGRAFRLGRKAMSARGMAALARWHREHHTRREWAPTGEAADIARCNLRALGREETPEAIRAEVERMERDNRMAWSVRGSAR